MRFLNPFRRGLCAGELEVQLATMHRSLQLSIHQLERCLMTQSDDLNTKISALETSSAASNAKSDLLITLVGDLRAELTAAQVGGTAIDLTSAIARIDAVTTAISAGTSKEDATLNPAPAAPPPTSTPVATP